MSAAAGVVAVQRSASWRRSWLAPAAWGAGLILSAMGAAALVSAMRSVPTALAGGAALMTGVVGLVWGAACLARGRILAPRAAIVGIVVALAVVAALMATTGGRASVAGAASAGVLLLACAALCAAEGRRRAAPSSVGVVPLLLAATLVAVLATPALGAVQDAATIRDDGTVPVISHHGH